MEGFVVDRVSKTYIDETQRPFQVLHEVSFSWSAGENIASPFSEKAAAEKAPWHGS